MDLLRLLRRPRGRRARSYARRPLVAVRALPGRALRGLWPDVTAAPAGAAVRLYYDAEPHVTVAPGDAIVTRTGRTYLIEAARLQTRGLHAGTRWHVIGRVVDAGDLAADTVRHQLFWYQRRRTRRVRRA